MIKSFSYKPTIINKFSIQYETSTSIKPLSTNIGNISKIEERGSYQILSLVDSYGNSHSISYSKDKTKFSPYPGGSERSFEELMKASDMKIQSVKRLSDGTIFSLGDQLIHFLNFLSDKDKVFIVTIDGIKITSSTVILCGKSGQDFSFGLACSIKKTNDYEITKYTSGFYDGEGIKEIVRNDGIIFKIGDLVKSPAGQSFTITRFYFDCNNDKLLCGPDHVSIMKIQKVEKLFTTEDGVDLYDEDTFVSVNVVENSIRALGCITYKGIDPEIARGKGVLWFSSEEIANEYILKNEMCLSYNDVETLFKEKGYAHLDELLNVVKKKLEEK